MNLPAYSQIKEYRFVFNHYPPLKPWFSNDYTKASILYQTKHYIIYNPGKL